MLKAMRTGSKSVIVKLTLFGMLIMAMLGLAIMDVQGMFRSGLKSTTVASIGRSKISVPEFERILDGNLRQQNIPLSEAIKVGIPQRVLMAEMDGRLFYREATDMGFLVDDATASKSIKALLKQFVEQGNMTEKDALNRILMNMGVSESQFVTGVKSEIATNTMLSLLKAGAYVPDRFVQDALTFKNEERQALYFKISPETTIKTPGDAELKEYYSLISKQFMLPEYRTFSVVLLDKKSLGIEQTKASPDALKEYYEKHKDSYTSPETRTLEQVVAKDEKTAKAIYAEAKKSSSLNAAATKEKATFIKEQTMSEKEMAVELATATFQSTTPGVLEPIQSPLGWHIINIKKINPKQVQSFDTVKASIEKEISQGQNDEALYQKASEIDDLIAGGKTLSDIAKEYKIKEHVYTDIDSSGLDRQKKKSAPALPLPDKILSQAFALDKNEASQLIETPGGDFLIVEVKDIAPAVEKPFESVKNDVIQSWKEQQKNKTLDEKASDISARLKKGESFEKLAQEMKKTPLSSGFLSRRSGADKSAPLDPSSIATLFSLEKVGDSASSISDGTIVVLKLEERRVKKINTESKEDTSAIRSLISRSIQSDIQEQYRNSLIKKHDVVLNNELMNELYNPLKADEAVATE